MFTAEPSTYEQARSGRFRIEAIVLKTHSPPGTRVTTSVVQVARFLRTASQSSTRKFMKQH